MCIFESGFSYDANHADVLDHYCNINIKVINIKKENIKIVIMLKCNFLINKNL